MVLGIVHPHKSMRGKPLLVRNQTSYILLVNSCNHSAATQITLTLTGLVGQDVTGECATTLDATGCRLFEALCSTTVGFNFRHEKLLHCL